MNKQVIQAEISISLAQASYWTAYAMTPNNLKREVKVGYSSLYGHEEFLTEEQLIEDAFSTAERHIKHAEELAQSLHESS